MDMGIAASSVGSTSKGRETNSSVSTIATDASTSVDRYSSSPTATSVAPHTSLQTFDKRPRDPVNPEFFYSSKMRVECRHPEWTLNSKIKVLIADYDEGRHLAPPNMVGYQDTVPPYLPHVLYFRQWAAIIRKFKKQLEVVQDQKVQWREYDNLLRKIRYDQGNCRSCLCDAQGSITFVPRPSPQPLQKGRGGNRIDCNAGYWAILCEWFYGCYCSVILENNDPSVEHIRQGLTWHAFQDAFNQIPDYIREDPLNRDFRWVVPEWLAEHPDQTIGYDPSFRVNVASPDEQPYFLEGPREVLPLYPNAALGIHQEAVPNLPPDDPYFHPPPPPEGPYYDPNYQGGGQPQADPFPADIEAYARQQASLWPLPDANQPLPPGQDAPSFFPMDIPPDYGNYPIDDGTGGGGGYYYGYPPGYNYGYPPGYDDNWPQGGGDGSGPGSGFPKKREVKFENSKAGDDETAHGIGEVDQGRREIAATA
ncbi:hypothetical protein TWF594_004206 [Orbilia oligospora]|nr:hypothetical protein TWF706_001903 [Orbilia oligospora]KAF3152527.1 hypothetical protein TWF594_004206 [Orbilia oligospora]